MDNIFGEAVAVLLGVILAVEVLSVLVLVVAAPFVFFYFLWTLINS